ncbi:MAG: phosphohydrolase, partial [Nonlabens sp.]
HLKNLMSYRNLTAHEASYFVFSGVVVNLAYAKAKPIQILNKKGKLTELIKAGKEDSFKALLKEVRKYYCCYPKLQD